MQKRKVSNLEGIRPPEGEEITGMHAEKNTGVKLI